MNFLFTGTIPGWQLWLLFIAASVFTFWTYQRPKLRSPWNWILPTTRILALGLLILMLFQPVLGRTHHTTIEGRIPVIIDTSGSMSVTDQRTPAQQIELAWQFGMFPRDMRSTIYKDQIEPAQTVLTTLTALASNPTTTNPNGIAIVIDQIEQISQAIKTVKHDNAPHKALHQKLSDVTAQMKRIREALDSKDKQSQIPEMLQQAAKVWNGIQESLPTQQAAFDQALAASGKPEIDQAIAQMATKSRFSWAQDLLVGEKTSLLAKLTGKGPVDLFTHDEPLTIVPAKHLLKQTAELTGTRTGTVIHQVLAQYEDQPVAAMVLLSDGNVNSGKPISEVRKQLSDRGITLHVVGIGNERPPSDVVLERVISPETSFKDDSISVSAMIRRPGYETSALAVRIMRGSVEVAATQIPGDGSVVSFANLSFNEKNTGPHEYQLVVDALEGEAVETNNTQQFGVNVLEDPIRILFLDEFPRWETRYAALILQRDPRVDLTAVFADVLATQTEGTRGVLLPKDRDALFAYDVILMGDLNPHHFSNEQLENVQAFVSERGGTLVILAGEHHMPNEYRATPLNDVLPFRQSQRPGSARVNNRGIVEVDLDLRDTFSQDSLVQIGKTPDDSRALWKRLPGMNWVKSALAPSSIADELVHTSPQDWPVMLTGTPGAGKVLYLGSDSFWRWRYRAKWTYHQRLWSQILLWAIRGRTTGSDPHVKLMTDRPAYAPGETITLKARVFDKEGKPLVDGTVAAEVRTESGDLIRNLPFIYLENSGGEYRAQIRDLPKGHFQIVPQVSQLGDTPINATWEFEVRDLPTSEFVHLGRDTASLKQLADQYYDMSQATNVVDNIAPVFITESHRADLEIWNSLWLLAVVAALLGFEWQMRKRNKLV